MFNDLIIKAKTKNSNEIMKNLFENLLISKIKSQNINHNFYRFDLGQMMILYDDFFDVMLELYKLARENEKIEKLKQMFKKIARRFNEISITINKIA